jgi:hypothetical protein
MLAALLVARPAAAQAAPPTAQDKATAQAFFERALADMQAGRLEKACPVFAESLHLYYAPGTLFTLAECEAKRGHLAAALSRYEEYLKLYETLPPEKQTAQGSRRKDAQAQWAALDPVVPKLVVLLPQNAPRETRVMLDGQEIPAAMLGTALRIEPGDHILTTQAPGGPVTEHPATLAKGEARKLELDVKLPPGASPPALPTPADAPAPIPPLMNAAPPPGAAKGGRRTGAYIVGGVGLAGLVLGGVTGSLMLANKGVVDANCSDGSAGVKLCKAAAGVTAGNQAKTLGLISSIGFGAGLAGLGAAAILLLTEPSAPKQASRRGPAPVGAPSLWFCAGALPEPQGGAMLRVSGVW